MGFEFKYVTYPSSLYVPLTVTQFLSVSISSLLQALRVHKELVLVSPALTRTAFGVLLFAVLNVLSFFGTQLVYFDAAIRSFA